MRGMEEQIRDLREKVDRLKKKEDEMEFILHENQQQVDKMKKKTYQAMIDAGASLKRQKYLEKENQQLREKVEELREGKEDVSELDEQEQRKILE